MSLCFMYITNRPEIAAIAQKYGVERIWIDLEKDGKQMRQKDFDSVKSFHTVQDIPPVRSALSQSQLLVRVNPWGENSECEIRQVIDSGADMIMLPMWKSPFEVERFLKTVGHQVKTVLLLETKEAVDCLDSVLEMDFDEIHIGLNDLHISYGMKFLFEPLASGMVDTLCRKFQKRGVPYGFGGIARLGGGLLSAERVILEHYRLGSSRAILSRSFCNVTDFSTLTEIDALFSANLRAIRQYELYAASLSKEALEENRKEVIRCVDEIVSMKGTC